MTSIFHYAMAPVFVAGVFLSAAIPQLLGPRPDFIWYERIARPSFAPPNWVFGPAWTVLYILMGVAAWMVWRQRGFINGGIPLGLFAAQLLLNVTWTTVFFGLRAPGWAFLHILALDAVVAMTMIAFLRVNWTAGLLLAPYMCWILFASALNFAFWRLNSSVLSV